MHAAFSRDGDRLKPATSVNLRDLILGGLLLALSLIAISIPVAAQQPDAPRGVTVVGLGEVRAKPDLAVVRIGVVSQGATARAALDENNKSMQAILAALSGQAIAEGDVQTSQFTVQPRYHHDPEGQDPPRIDGYEVSNQVAVTIRNLDSLGAVLDLAVGVGSNQILGIDFTLADPEPKRDEARRLAVADARRKAELYAEAAGLELGAIHTIAEQARLGPPEPMYARSEMAVSATVPIAEGQQVVAVEVTISWDFR